MKMIEAIVNPSKFENLKASLFELGITELDVSEVLIFREYTGYESLYRGTGFRTNYTSKMDVVFMVVDDQLDQVVEKINEYVRTDIIDDGMVRMNPIEKFIDAALPSG